MGRYDVEYWDTNFIKTPFSEECYWECKITDTKTGITGICSQTHSSKKNAYNDAWADLKNKLSNYQSENSSSSNTSNNKSKYNRSRKSKSKNKYSDYDYSSMYEPSSRKQGTTFENFFPPFLTLLGILLFSIVAIIFIQKSCNTKVTETDNSTNTFSVCNECNGSGVIPNSINCKICKGKGSTLCDSCSGMKTISCDICRRVGAFRCPKCEKYINWGYIDCPTCNKEGYIIDNNNNRITCPKCEGKRVYTCDYCNGRGTVKCSKCKGSGYIDCQSCLGIGSITCNTCSGLGHFDKSFTCNSCNGSGKIRIQ